MINSSDKEIRAAKVFQPNGNGLKSPINLLYTLETAMPPSHLAIVMSNWKSNDSEEIVINHDKDARPKRKTNEIARNKLKDYYAGEIVAFVWC